MVLHFLPPNSLLHSPPRTRLCGSNGRRDSSASLEDRPHSLRMARAVARAGAARPEHPGRKAEPKKRRRRGKSAGSDLWPLGSSVRAAPALRALGELSARSRSHTDGHSGSTAYAADKSAAWKIDSRNSRYDRRHRDGQEVDTLELGVE